MEDEQHILVIDDDRRLRELLRRYLTDNGFRVTVADQAATARQHLAAMTFDLIVLDLMMPGETGLELARSLRESGNDVPILMLTAMGDPSDRIGGLEAGADDYLPKPFEPRELLLRIRTILRRSMAAPEVPVSPVSPEILLGDYRFDRTRETLFQHDRVIRLTSAEASLLAVLSETPGDVMSRETLARQCAVDGGDRAIDVHVARLRRKIEPDPKAPRYLQTVRGRGYVLRAD